ncbi:MAG: 50S ribosomal protein L6 [Chthoniobacterales bacterium]
MSRLGNKPFNLPDKVKVTVDDGRVLVEGGKGKLDWTLPEGITLKVDDNNVVLSRKNDSGKMKAMHGLARSLVFNMVTGVSEGYKKDLEIHGVGFRAAVQGSNLNLNLGFSHPINYPIPSSLKISVTDNTKISIEGIDKQAVGQAAADIRRYYPPEPYKGKGVRYAGEQIRRKEGKTVQ